jgi:Rieske Fe-S protein
MPANPASTTPPTRRAVVAAASGAGLAAVLTACGSDSDPDKASDAPSSKPTGDAQSDSPSPAPAAGGKELAKTSDIPVGGGKIFADEKVVVTQPAEGQFKGFSAVCTHSGCALTQIAGGTINCLCHGSKFKVSDGSVVKGPATTPLATENVTVSGDTITLA